MTETISKTSKDVTSLTTKEIEIITEESPGLTKVTKTVTETTKVNPKTVTSTATKELIKVSDTGGTNEYIASTTNQEERDAKVRGRNDQHRYERESRQFKKEQDKKRAKKEVFYDGVAVKESVVKKAKAGDKKAQREIEAKKWRKKKNK